MNKRYQPFIIEKADIMLEILKDDIQKTDEAKNRLCNILTRKFIDGDMDAETPIHELLNKDEILMFIQESLIHEDLDELNKMGLLDYVDDENDEPIYFLTEKGKKYAETMLKKN